eukprot:CAMPEP_0175220098 /NCGR_PEP_ID=MMETSP0093-20121207/19607_1 /TAXON_ID=311494 /ORGANISM="Alexandrium monilatum, Strain CCMP3105" /LENGTH=420 /DNA_ID=CAMNT_0016513591 /DNA_START=56 /DNA_END=1318 /DNA_ORIENTATION=+
MIAYRKGCCGLPVILHCAGTTWPSGILPALLSACIGLIFDRIAHLDKVISDEEVFLDNPYPFQLFAFLVGFVMVFRTNFAYQRWWEALDAVQRMGAKWFDGACMTIAFDAPGDVNSPFLVGGRAPQKPSEPNQTGREHAEFMQEILHLFSLLHALALQHLRCDPDLRNLQVQKILAITDELPSSVKGLAQPTPEISVPTCGLGAHGLVAFSEARIKGKHQLQKLKILGSLRPEELVLLDACTRHSQAPTLARVAMVQGWIMRRLLCRQKHESRGDMGKTSPPILSRLCHVIADGHLGFNQASKVVIVPFPFEYHNIIRLFLWIYAFTVPFVVNSNVFTTPARFTLTFLVVWAYFALCKVGDNLEDPFLPYDDNELPLQSIQQGFNARLLTLRTIPAKPVRSVMGTKESAAVVEGHAADGG